MAEEKVSPPTYEFSGRVSSRLIWVGFVYFLVAVSFGWVYQSLLDLNPLILLSPLLTILFGLLLGSLGIACLRLGGVRNRRISLLLLWGLSLVFYASALALAMGVFDPGFESLGAALRSKFTKGDPIPGSQDFVSPGVLGVAYGAEIFLLLLCGFGFPWTWWKSAVFDEDKGAFVPRERLGHRFGPGPETFLRMVQDQGISAILDPVLRPFAENGEEGEFRFYVHRAEKEAYLSIIWRGGIRGPSGKKIVREWTLLRRIQVEEEILQGFQSRSLRN
jgi:hypothetical protein